MATKAATPAAPKPLPFQYQLIAGAVAGTTELLILFPLDVVKTRFQLQVGKGGADGYTSMMDCFRKIVQREGYAALYRGILPPILVETPKRAIKFTANEQYGKLYSDYFTSDGKMNQNLSILTGVSAGVTEGVVIVPFDLVKVRLQDPASVGRLVGVSVPCDCLASQRSLYKNTFDCFSKILRTEGPLAFFNGLESTVWRNGVWNGFYFGSIFRIREWLPPAKTSNEKLLNNFLAGFIGGTLGTTFNTPFDVVKTRIQNAQRSPNTVRLYNWTLPSLVTVARSEGIAALWKGYVPKVVRLGPGGGILLVVFDVVANWIRANLL